MFYILLFVICNNGFHYEILIHVHNTVPSYSPYYPCLITAFLFLPDPVSISMSVYACVVWWTLFGFFVGTCALYWWTHHWRKCFFFWHIMSTGKPCEPSPTHGRVLTGPTLQLLGRRSQLLWVESVTVTTGLETSVSCPVSYVLPTPPATMPPQLWEGFYPCPIFYVFSVLLTSFEPLQTPPLQGKERRFSD